MSRQIGLTLDDTNDVFSFTIDENGDIATVQEIDIVPNLILVLFTDGRDPLTRNPLLRRGWWGNLLYVLPGSLLWILQQAKATDLNASRVETSVLEALVTLPGTKSVDVFFRKDDLIVLITINELTEEFIIR